MFKVLLWDYAGFAEEWIEKFSDKKYVEIVGTIRPQDSVPEILLKQDAWDWLLIFEQGQRNFFDATIQMLKLPPDRIIYALDIINWAQHPKAAFALNNPATAGATIHLQALFAINQQINNFTTCTVEGLSYIATSKDIQLMRVMYVNRVNYAAENMKQFQALAKKYYNIDDGGGVFLDLGANIGTTGIYFTKKLAPNLKLLAFEPDTENFKLLRINLILNDMGDDKVTAVNCGLGDKFDEMTMYRDLANPGHNSFTDPKDNIPTETVKIMPLDAYFDENKISARDVKYIWIDTEGFEPQVLFGAKKILTENSAPLFMEFNPMVWSKSGNLKGMINLLKEVGYTHYLWIPEVEQTGTEKLYTIDNLWNFRTATNPIGSMGDIFLIKN